MGMLVRIWSEDFHKSVMTPTLGLPCGLFSRISEWSIRAAQKYQTAPGMAPHHQP